MTSSWGEGAQAHTKERDNLSQVVCQRLGGCERGDAKPTGIDRQIQASKDSMPTWGVVTLLLDAAYPYGVVLAPPQERQSRFIELCMLLSRSTLNKLPLTYMLSGSRHASMKAEDSCAIRMFFAMLTCYSSNLAVAL